ncbi:STAS domain-containing protein [Streptomyces sp. NP160]|uniref:STAS domain-containing protein n=1 Tax=Streptomyces sp. NP160 TaxID=2586637 RepID=UPI001118A3F4|nr:STAS domain-containing protein [Streptomyces sp. NP160]TNM67738.1 STAS domain-containing protein [Streptomyces sp. NP160]
MSITTSTASETGDLPGADDVVVVRVEGDLDIRTAPELREVLRRLLRPTGTAGAQHVVVDLRAATFMDSYALGVLVQGYKLSRAHRRTFELVSTGPGVATLFRVTGMQHVMPLHPDVASALHERRTARVG